MKNRPAPPSPDPNRPPEALTPPFWRYVLIGFLTLAPLWVTWLVFNFLFGLLSNTGAPFLRGVALGLRPFSETLADWLSDSSVQYLLAALITLVGLYGVGRLTSMVLGRRLIAFLERQLSHLPLVQTIYGATKRFLQNLQKPLPSGQRVVLITFPSPPLKTLGFMTKLLTDSQSGRQLAAVYVPTAPNPTSGYIEIVPLEEVVLTDWTMEEAMSFIMTGGTNAPDHVRFTAAPASEEAPPQDDAASPAARKRTD